MLVTSYENQQYGQNARMRRGSLYELADELRVELGTCGRANSV